MSYFNVYKRRINRYGNTFHERLENGRQHNFQLFKSQSPHYVQFEYKDKIVDGVLEPRRQNETKTMVDLLCDFDQNFDIGDIVTIKDSIYMFLFHDERHNSGYNRYCLVKMSHYIDWKFTDGNVYTSHAYMYFQQDNMLKNEPRSRSRSSTLYLENLKLNFLLLPFTDKIEVDTYMIISTMDKKQQFRVTGYDIVSTPGVMYVSMDPTYARDLTPAPEMEAGDDEREWFWLNGGEGVI